MVIHQQAQDRLPEGFGWLVRTIGEEERLFQPAKFFCHLHADPVLDEWGAVIKFNRSYIGLGQTVAGAWARAMVGLRADLPRT